LAASLHPDPLGELKRSPRSPAAIAGLLLRRWTEGDGGKGSEPTYKRDVGEGRNLTGRKGSRKGGREPLARPLCRSFCPLCMCYISRGTEVRKASNNYK